MKPLLFLLACILSLPATGIPGATASFLGENVISGKVLEITPEGVLKLDAPFLTGPSEFRIDGLLQLDLDTTRSAEQLPHLVHATSGTHYKDTHRDTLSGTLLSLDDKTVTIKTPYAGELALNREMIRNLNISSSAPGLYNGPDDLEKWTLPEGMEMDGSWVKKGGAFISSSNIPIAREVKSGQRTHFSFTADWKGEGDFHFQFFGNQGNNNQAQRRYDFSINNAVYVRVMKYWQRQNGGQAQLFQASYNQLRSQTRATFDLYLDRTGKSPSALYIDGQKIGFWSDDNQGEGFGDWIQFIPDAKTPLRLSKITVRGWDGRLPEGPIAEVENEGEDGPPPAPGPPEQIEGEGQRIELANGDTIVGSLKGVEGDNLNIETQLGPIAVPIARAQSIALREQDLPGEEEPGPRMYPEDIRAWFHDGGYVTIRLESLKDGKIKGFSQIFGDAEFDLNAFSRLDFNIWKTEFNSQRGGAMDW